MFSLKAQFEKSKTNKDVAHTGEQIEEYQIYRAQDKETKKAKYTDMANKYYDLANNHFESGWGQSFHLAPRWIGETLHESLKRHEHHLALALGLKSGMKVLDIGCGIGGPLREIARFSSASITGVTINDQQIARGKELNKLAGLEDTCGFVNADFMKMPFSDNTFDAIYEIEATYHAPDAVACYKEIFRVLKPGHCFAAYEWGLTNHFNPNNSEHQKIKADMEFGYGVSNVRTTAENMEALRLAGFEILREKDLALDSPVPWYLPLEARVSTSWITSFQQFLAKLMVKILELFGLVPKGSADVSALLDKGLEALSRAGRKEIFTPMYFFVARKPLSA